MNGSCRYLLGMDCGTTNIKAVILSEDGTIAAEAGRPSRFIVPGPNMQEQSALEWWENAVAIFHELSEQAGTEVMKNVCGICISSHTVSMLPLDAEGNPLRNALTYQDGRSAAQLHEIVRTVGESEFVRIVGGQPSVAFLPNKILWYKRNEPDLYAQTSCFLQASSYINFRLTGRMTSDLDQAARTQCLDVNTMKWSEAIGLAIGVDLERVLPEPLAVDEIIGSVTAEAAKLTGLMAGTPVLAGCSDAMAAMYATGMSHLGEAGESSGTTSLVFVGSMQQSRPDLPVVTKPCAIEGMPWVFDAPIQTSGAALKWFIETMADREVLEAENQGLNIYTYLNQRALEAEPGSSGVFFFPYLLGERAPLWNEYARGMFLGLGMDLKREDLIRAVFEGTAYALRHVMETVKESGGTASALRICGGGAKSRTWSMIKASMLRMPVYVLDETSGDVPVGDALIAGTRTGVFTDLTSAAERVIKVKEVIEPIEEWAQVYDRLYPYYVQMYAHLDQDLMQLQQTLEEIAR